MYLRLLPTWSKLMELSMVNKGRASAGRGSWAASRCRCVCISWLCDCGDDSVWVRLALVIGLVGRGAGSVLVDYNTGGRTHPRAINLISLQGQRDRNVRNRGKPTSKRGALPYMSHVQT